MRLPARAAPTRSPPDRTSWVAVALVWKWLLNPSFGLVNNALAEIGIQGPAAFPEPANEEGAEAGVVLHAELGLVRIPAEGGAVEAMIAGERSVGSFSEEAQGLIAALVSEPHLPSEVFLFDKGTLRRLTHTNDIEDRPSHPRCCLAPLLFASQEQKQHSHQSADVPSSDGLCI